MGKMIFNMIVTMICITCIALPAHAVMESENFTISNMVFTGGGGLMDSNNYQADITLGQPLSLTTQESASYTLQAGFWNTVEVEPMLDNDNDGIPNDEDNCLNTPNGPNGGTCSAGNAGEPCMSSVDCGSAEFCSMNQEDYYPPQGNNCGDACECEGNFDGDPDQDGTDAFTFKQDFGRSRLQNPCTALAPCNGDFLCDTDVDGTDAFTFKTDFGRGTFNRPCPYCVTIPWCNY